MKKIQDMTKGNLWGRFFSLGCRLYFYNIPLYYLTAFPCICTFLRISDLKPNYFFVFQGGGTQEYREYFKFRQRRKAEKESV